MAVATAWVILPSATAGAAGDLPHGARTVNSDSAGPRLSPTFSYDLVTALGGVDNYGGAGWYGDELSRHLAAPIVGMAVTPNGLGYWLVGANGSVFNLGDAGWYGSLAGDSLGLGQTIIGMAATSDGRGYWLINASGEVTSFGDAAAINHGQSLPHADLAIPIVSAAIQRGGGGAWFTDTAGHVFVVGDAAWYGSRAGLDRSDPITSIAPIPSGRGYWLTDATGNVWGFGGATTGAPGPRGLASPVVGIIPAESRYGYWVTTSTGSIIDGGDASTRPGTVRAGDAAGVVGIAAARQVDPPPLPPGTVGYDINWPQCAFTGSKAAGTLPGPPGDAAGTMAYAVAVVGVDGWAIDDDNPCLAAEAGWARKAVYPKGSSGTGEPPYDLYMFLNSPASTSTIDQTGPAGTCSKYSGSQWQSCLAYNYGYNSARAAVSYATSQGAQSNVWWLDIENATCAPGMWNHAADGEWWSCDLWLNARTIQGAIDGLRSLSITPGIYCTATQWGGITNHYVPSGGAPWLWIAGATWTSPPYPSSFGFVPPSEDSKFCTETQYRFAGGTPVLLQETPGADNNYPFDPDISC